MGGENDGFNLFCFFVGVKIKLKGMLFQNLYEDILVRQKLKTKQEILLLWLCQMASPYCRNSFKILNFKNIYILFFPIISELIKFHYNPNSSSYLCNPYIFLLAVYYQKAATF